MDKAIDRRWPLGAIIFLGWLFIQDRDDECTSISRTGTLFKGGNCLPNKVVRGSGGTGTERPGRGGVPTLACPPGGVILEKEDMLSVAMDGIRGLGGAQAF